MILSFSKDRFVHAIVAGEKKTTIRADRASRWVPGRTIQFWRGSPRNVHGKIKPYQFGNGICWKTQSIVIMRSEHHSLGFQISIDGFNLNNSEIRRVCKLDGLTDREFRVWFLPPGTDIFHGTRIFWKETSFAATISKKKTLEIPEKFKRNFGTKIDYSKGNKKVCTGIIIGARFSSTKIMNLETKERWYGIQLKVKPVDGFNRNRAIYTPALNSGIPIPKDLD